VQLRSQKLCYNAHINPKAMQKFTWKFKTIIHYKNNFLVNNSQIIVKSHRTFFFSCCNESNISTLTSGNKFVDHCLYLTHYACWGVAKSNTIFSEVFSFKYCSFLKDRIFIYFF